MSFQFDRKFRAILERSGKVDLDKLDEVQVQSEQEHISIAEAVSSKGLISERDFVAIISREANLPPIDLDQVETDPDALDLLTVETAEGSLVLPICKIGSFLTIALANPFDVTLLDHLRLQTGCELRPLVASHAAVKRSVAAAYRRGEQKMDDLLGESDEDITLKEFGDEDVEDLNSASDDDSKVVKAVNMILYQAVTEKVSDIHVEPFERYSRVRFRKDGLLREVHSFKRSIHNAFISRLKIMGSLDIAEKRRPQDGKFQIKVNAGQVDIRLSILPVVHGEKAVMRLLDSSNLVLNLDDLGFEPECLEGFRRSIQAPYGMILVTGPTGSGKSTTLYSAVRELLSDENNFITVEDPVEYQLQGVNQVPVNNKRGLTFAAALRSILRQDPDVIMVGEIRDKETIEIAIKAALTGHLVLSTLHTNDAPSAVTRMVQMGIDPFLVSSSVLIVAAQRLARKLCPACRKQVTIPKDRLLEMGFQEGEIEGSTIYAAEGCRRCVQGYKGRFALLEVLEMMDNVRESVLANGNELQIKRAALENGMITLRRAAIRNVIKGTTSVEEMLRVTTVDEKVARKRQA